MKSIPFDEVAQRFTPRVGKDTTIGDLIEVANDVAWLYQDRRFVLSFAFMSARSFADGIVRVTALLPKGRDNATYLAAHAAAPVGSNGLIANLDALHYRGNPLDNPGLPSCIQHTVTRWIGGSLAYPILLNDTQSVLGTASIYASHHEDRHHNEQTISQISLRSQVRVMQLQAGFTGVQTSQVRSAGIRVSKVFDTLSASKSGNSNVPGAIVTNPASINFVKSRASFSQINEWH